MALGVVREKRCRRFSIRLTRPGLFPTQLHIPDLKDEGSLQFSVGLSHALKVIFAAIAFYSYEVHVFAFNWLLYNFSNEARSLNYNLFTCISNAP